ncbi:hypothetical protein E2C01_014471 [Portunus trituberculatus]|uniref:Uncharacterized protein n=1 Tax=Portunus trituberculatus TaxID=210409 RepID=A0A5B7DIX0_PORTR|nr:hypothetical protein [Portunus trituberculatus]
MGGTERGREGGPCLATRQPVNLASLPLFSHVALDRGETGQEKQNKKKGLRNYQIKESAERKEQLS